LIQKEITVPACYSIKVDMVFYNGVATVPFEGTFFYKDGTSDTYSGIWSGVAVIDEVVQTTVIDNNVCAKILA
jgi:hypothetical protein